MSAHGDASEPTQSPAVSQPIPVVQINENATRMHALRISEILPAKRRAVTPPPTIRETHSKKLKREDLSQEVNDVIRKLKIAKGASAWSCLEDEVMTSISERDVQVMDQQSKGLLQVWSNIVGNKTMDEWLQGATEDKEEVEWTEEVVFALRGMPTTDPFTYAIDCFDKALDVLEEGDIKELFTVLRNQFTLIRSFYLEDENKYQKIIEQAQHETASVAKAHQELATTIVQQTQQMKANLAKSHEEIAAQIQNLVEQHQQLQMEVRSLRPTAVDWEELEGWTDRESEMSLGGESEED